jgi:sterol desaturase/sphingolipid hydroxylase (fatty acid hydroxylase superfamily)
MSAIATLALVAAILLLVLLEFRDRQFAQSWYHERARLLRNLGYLAATMLLMPLLPVINGAIRQIVPPLLNWGGPGVIEFVACFLLAELLGWLLHYVKHTNGFLWAFHFQHHREEQFNVWMTAHTHALEVVVSTVVMALIMRLLGFSAGASNAYLIFYSFVKVYQHSARRYRLGALDYFIVGPAYHRLHHQINSRCNYAVSLTVFDILFRTACWPDVSPAAQQSRYGIDGELPFGFWQEMIFFLRRRESSKAGSSRLSAKLPVREPSAENGTGTFCSQGIAK